MKKYSAATQPERDQLEPYNQVIHEALTQIAKEIYGD